MLILGQKIPIWEGNFFSIYIDNIGDNSLKEEKNNLDILKCRKWIRQHWKKNKILEDKDKYNY